MKTRLTMLALAVLPALSAPVLAQSYAEQQRWQTAQRRYDSETRIYERERALYERAQARSNRGYYPTPSQGGYAPDDRYAPGYATPQGGYASPQGGYAPSQGGYAPSQGGYVSPQGGYTPPPGAYVTEYDASRDYRDDARYQERTLSSNDQVYRGSDGKYYCKRNDGTTGLIVGGASGALLGNVIDGGRNRVAGTLIGGALGAILGKKVDQSNGDVRCK